LEKGKRKEREKIIKGGIGRELLCVREDGRYRDGEEGGKEGKAREIGT
jgi:hypothetical protein